MPSTSSSAHQRANPSLVFTKDAQGKMTIAPKDLGIVWAEDERYWNIPKNANNSAEAAPAPAPAHLLQVCWLEVTGSVGGTDPKKNYDVGFSVSLTQDAFGWGTYPVYIMAKRGKQGKRVWTKVLLNKNESKRFEIKGTLKADKSVDTLKAEKSVDDKRVYFGLYEVWSGKWKGGLKIHNAFITEITESP